MAETDKTPGSHSKDTRKAEAATRSAPQPEVPPRWKTGDPAELARVAEWYLTHDSPERVRPLRSVADKPETPSEWLERLSVNEDEVVRRRIAGNPSTPATTLGRMWDEYGVSDPVLGAALAGNPSTPATTLGRMWDEYGVSDPVLGAALAGNLSTPATILVRMWDEYKAGYHVVGAGLAGNPATPADILRELVDHPPLAGVLVANEMLPSDCRDSVTLSVAKHGNENEARRLARSERQLSDATVRALTGHDSEWVRTAAARRPELPSEKFGSLMTDPSHWVRKQIAARADCPLPVLKVLARDEESVVRAAVATNPAADKSVRRAVRLAGETRG